MSGSYNRKTCCDRDCAAFNFCQIGGIQCKDCGRYFCSEDLNKYGYCDECAAQREEEEEEDE